MTITLYHAAYSRSFRIAWLLEEMELEHELKIVPQATFRQFARSEEYRKISPTGKYPAIQDGAFTMVESTAIMEYLLSRYGDGPTAGGLKPEPGTQEYGRYLQWFEYGEAGMGPSMNMLLAHALILPEKHRIPAIAEWAQKEVYACVDFISDGLGDKPFICGDSFTAADISIGYMLLLLKIMGRLDAAPENVQAYFDRLRGREAWKTVSAKAG